MVFRRPPPPLERVTWYGYVPYPKVSLTLLFILSEFNLKGNKLSDKRFMKLVDQCRTKQILDYIRDHCPKGDVAQPTAKGKGKKAKKDELPPENQEEQLCHALKILHVEDDVIRVKIMEQHVANVRPYILCCLVKNLAFDETLFKKFIQMQTKLHDTVCDKRNTATIATHDLSKIAPGMHYINCKTTVAYQSFKA